MVPGRHFPSVLFKISFNVKGEKLEKRNFCRPFFAIFKSDLTLKAKILVLEKYTVSNAGHQLSSH